MKLKILLTTLIISLFLPVIGQNDFTLVKQRVLDKILDQNVSDQEITKILQSLNEDGSWPGINYEDLSNTGFQHIIHLQNMEDLSLAFNSPDSRFYNDKEIIESVNRSLAFWVENDFICENWWHNQIGTPNSLVTVLLLMDEHVKPDIKKEALAIIDRANLEASGARPGGDRIKIGGIAAKRVLAMDDPVLFTEIIKVINNEIHFRTGLRGMQHDFSFHHRTDRVNNTVSYGSGYAKAFAEWAAYVRDTKYAFSRDKIELLTDYYLDGISKQYIYGKYTDWGVMNRSVSRGRGFRMHGTGILEDLLKVSDYRKDEVEQMIRLRKGGSVTPPSFCKFFWQSEHFVFQRPGFYTSVRMYSTRNRNMEAPYNSEGLKNHHKGDGANFLSVRGDEYLGIWPVYDWQKIPGTTVLQKDKLSAPSQIQKDGLTEFVGAVTDGMYGAAAFDFLSPHDFIKARKSWFFFDEEYVCLGAGIESGSGNPMVSTVNQCLLEGAVLIEDQQGIRKIENGYHKLTGAKRIYHDKVGYIFPESASLHLSNQDEKGSWWEISKQWSTSKEEIIKPVFKLWIDHGVRPQGRRGGLNHDSMVKKDITYGYIVVPAIDEEEFMEDRDIEILANNRDIQAVKHNSLGLVQVISYRAGSVKISKNRTLIMDSPGAIMLEMENEKIKKMTVSDPSRKLGRLHFSISGKTGFDDGEKLQASYDRKQQMTHFSIMLPQGDFAGKSVSAAEQ